MTGKNPDCRDVECILCHVAFDRLNGTFERRGTSHRGGLIEKRIDIHLADQELAAEFFDLVVVCGPPIFALPQLMDWGVSRWR